MQTALKRKKLTVALSGFLLKQSKKVFNIVIRTLGRISKRNYYFAKALGVIELRFLDKLNGRAPILIYQMGKVGSTTVLSSLKALELDRPIYHIHTLTPEGIDYHEKVYKAQFHRHRRIYDTHLNSLYLSKRVSKHSESKPWHIITLVRDPIARNISAFFQTLERYHEEYDQLLENDSHVQPLIDLFFEEYEFHDEPLTWFNSELKRNFDIDVFSEHFPKKKGYKIYEREHARVLLLKLETLKECATEAFNEFLNIDKFTLKNKNVAREKAYYPLYRKVRDAIVVPDFYIEKLYTSKYIRHFYSKEEIDSFKKRWCG